MADRICTITHCVRPHYAKGWCNLHWKRWRKHGDPLRVAKPGPNACQIDSCGQPVVSHKMCSKHYQRWVTHGDPRMGARQRNRCAIDGCDSLVVGRGWCQKHYSRWKAHGDPLTVTVVVGDDVARFEGYLSLGTPPAHAPDLGPCWLWTGGCDPDGYAKMHTAGEQSAHRWSYTYHVGPIPAGLEIDHLCRVRACVNPLHLDVVPHRVNVLRAAEVRYGRERDHSEVAVSVAS